LADEERGHSWCGGFGVHGVMLGPLS